jgi:hypothetical protein
MMIALAHQFQVDHRVIALDKLGFGWNTLFSQLDVVRKD